LRTFRSDNNSGLCPEALQAIIDANRGHAVGYGDDPFTADAVAELRRIFGDRTEAWFVATGTAANSLALASLTEPWQQVISHVRSHHHTKESTTPERVAHCRSVAVPTETGKLVPDDVARARIGVEGSVYEPQAGVVTIANPTEFGNLYTAEETAALCDAAHAAGFRFHVDGARFANAVAALGCDPRDLTVHAGVDALSFGGTKNGLACGEAVLLFPQEDGRVFERARAAFPFHRMSLGHLVSKHRFISAPFAAALRDGAWLRHAAHANQMATRLGEGLQRHGFEIRFETQTNGVFVTLSDAADEALRRAGHAYYPFGDPDWNMFRMMSSFDTQAEEVDALLSDAEKVAG